MACCAHALSSSVHYFGEINNAASVAEQERIGARYGIRVV